MTGRGGRGALGIGSGRGKLGRGKDGLSDGSNQAGRRNSDSDNQSGGDGSGLNPNKVKGFGYHGSSNKPVETPSLNEMRAKQGAIVAKFMTFFKRQSTLVIESYEACFYKEKPKWDQIAEFVFKDLCPSDELRKAVKDVQLHPVKMLLFIKINLGTK